MVAAASAAEVVAVVDSLAAAEADSQEVAVVDEVEVAEVDSPVVAAVAVFRVAEEAEASPVEAAASSNRQIRDLPLLSIAH